AATKRDQAKIVFKEAKAMVNASASLRRRVDVKENNLSVAATLSLFEPLSSDARTLDGLNISGAIVDELHAHRDRGAIDLIETATGARRQPLIFEITTAGQDIHSVCREHHNYSRHVLEGVLADDSWFSFIATIDEGDDWQDPKTWAKANPGYGHGSPKKDDLERLCLKAQSASGARNTFKRLRLNIWTDAVGRWLDLTKWDACLGAVDEADLKGRACFVGIDLSSKIDLTAVAFLFPPLAGEREWIIIVRFYVPEDNIEVREKNDKVPYKQWVEDGWITATPGNIVDYDVIRGDINAAGDKWSIQQIGYDPWNAAHMATSLTADEFTMVEVRQGVASMGGPSKDFEALVMAGLLRHGGNPVLRWCAANVALRIDGNENYMPDKKKSTERIDGIVAVIIALGRGLVSDGENAGVSIYSDRELLVV
ncbi:MAG: terminase large subunit, partial [Alphaproteobacteria bacterium]